jgi:hypothetical protein
VSALAWSEIKFQPDYFTNTVLEVPKNVSVFEDMQGWNRETWQGNLPQFSEKLTKEDQNCCSSPFGDNSK